MPKKFSTGQLVIASAWAMHHIEELNKVNFYYLEPNEPKIFRVMGTVQDAFLYLRKIETELYFIYPLTEIGWLELYKHLNYNYIWRELNV